MSLTGAVLRFAAPIPRPESFRRVLFIGPHPDDIEIGAGATAARLAAEGKEICFLVCIDGRYGSGNAPEGIRGDKLAALRKEEARQREEVAELLRIVGLDDVQDELSTSLPYGKQRRLEIARALATNPKLLLLDEPAAGMNPQETDELTEFIGQIRNDFDMTILLIEHHMNLVMGISDRIYVLDFGRLISSGTPDVVQSDQKVIDAYLGVADEDA